MNRPEGADESPVWRMGDRLVEQVDAQEYIKSLSDTDLREFVIEILMITGETAGVLMREIEEIKESINKGGSK